MLADLEDWDDVRVREAGGGFRFGFESFDQIFRGECAGADELERHEAIQTDLARFENSPHSTTSDFFEQFVIAEITNCANCRFPVSDFRFPVIFWAGIPVSEFRKFFRPPEFRFPNSEKNLGRRNSDFRIPEIF